MPRCRVECDGRVVVTVGVLVFGALVVCLWEPGGAVSALD